jgi:hypothetical protein
MTQIQNNHDELSDDKSHKIEALRQMILNAERTMASAKAMLLQLEGKKKTGRKRKTEEDEEGGTIVEGTFDGQIMIGTDGKQYPVPANYASKSKLVEGDMLKLTITYDGSFIYKQIGPVDRKHAIGIVSQDEKGNYYIFSEGKPYKVLLASVTYFKAEPGDEVAMMVPRQIEATWAAIENVLQKGGTTHNQAMDAAIEAPSVKKLPADGGFNSWKDDFKEEIPKKKNEPAKTVIPDDLIDEWTSDIEELEKEISIEN